MSNLDPSTLSSSKEIFSGSHTLPQIRTLHKNIHVAIEEKATRLRTQVGSSYRELLGTADTIVQMRQDNEEVQELLGTLGAHCGRAVIGAKATGLATFTRGQTRAEATEAARIKLLERCCLVAGRILKGGGGIGEGVSKGDRLILAAKVLVLCRLLLKSIGEKLIDQQLRPDVDAVKKTHDALRRRFLRHTQKILDAVADDDDREDILKGMCAYSLATSSSARNVLRQYLRIREEAITVMLGINEKRHERKQEDVIRGLQLYTRTLLNVQALFPSKLSQALAGLKKTPLLADPSLMALNGLRLDVYERWCGEEIQYFTPFIHHDDLDVSQAKDVLMSWAKVGGQALLSGIVVTLDQMNEFKSIMELRTSVLQLWIREGGRVRGFDPSEMQDKLRGAINARMLSLLETKVGKLRLVKSEIEATLESWRDGVTDRNKDLWDESSYDMSLSNGAALFIEDVVSRLYGRNDAVSKASNSYSTWFQVIDDVKEVVESLRKQRWDNDFDEIEDEETIEERQQALSREDPKELQEKLDAALDKSFLEFDAQVTELWERRAGKPNRGGIAIYLLRVVREIRNKLPDRPVPECFGLEIIPAFQRIATDTVARGPLDAFTTALLAERTVVGRPLWEGEPPLPGQPSTHVFEFLRNLSVSMSDSGLDLWSPAAVVVMKEYLHLFLEEIWMKAIRALDEQPTTEETKEDDDEDSEDKKEPENKAETQPSLSDDKNKELLIQWQFDVAYILACTALKGETGKATAAFKKLEDTIAEKNGLDESDRRRITKSAAAFWQRTNLLFGLLAHEAEA